MNAKKRLVTIDLATDHGVSDVHAMAATVYVLLETARLGEVGAALQPPRGVAARCVRENSRYEAAATVVDVNRDIRDRRPGTVVRHRPREGARHASVKIKRTGRTRGARDTNPDFFPWGYVQAHEGLQTARTVVAGQLVSRRTGAAGV